MSPRDCSIWPDVACCSQSSGVGQRLFLEPADVLSLAGEFSFGGSSVAALDWHLILVSENWASRVKVSIGGILLCLSHQSLSCSNVFSTFPLPMGYLGGRRDQFKCSWPAERFVLVGCTLRAIVGNTDIGNTISGKLHRHLSDCVTDFSVF